MSDDFRTRAALERVAATHGLDAAQAGALSAFVELLLGWRRANVTGLTDPVAVVDKLIGDSLALLSVPQLRERGTGAWLDLGAGAGIPGIPLAVAVPAATVTLLDAVARKCAFLEAAVTASGLTGRARVVCARSERYSSSGAPGRDAHAVVLARAVSELPVLVELAAPLLAEGGVLLASKTRRALEEEGDAAAAAAERCGLAPEPPVLLFASPLDEAVCAVFRKTAPTADWLPRREGMAAKRPLGA
ncbi:MAG: 16S rRNA (guanine(527)-N(7))-methyltransferase RsmG [Deltaproteobacteria bacterium]